MNSQDAPAKAPRGMTPEERTIAESLLQKIDLPLADHHARSIAIANYDSFFAAVQRRLDMEYGRIELTATRCATGISHELVNPGSASIASEAAERIKILQQANKDGALLHFWNGEVWCKGTALLSERFIERSFPLLRLPSEA